MATAERWIDADDGFRLSVVELVPSAPPCGVAIVGHAMMVDRRTVYRADRPSLATTLQSAGFLVLVPDQRGHGVSGPGPREGGGWTYDRLVADVPIYLEAARSRLPGAPIALVGNSLFGHLALAHLGRTDEPDVAALVAFAVNIWSRAWTPSVPRWWLKRGAIALSSAVAAGWGHLPVRALSMGSDDEPAAYWRALTDAVRSGRWRADDGHDYGAHLGRVRPPLLQVVSDGDRLLAAPDDALAFTAEVPRREVLRLGKGCTVPALRGLAPGHVEMVAHPRCLPLWRHVARWCVEALTDPTRGASSQG